MEKKKYDSNSELSILNETFIPYTRQEEYETAKRREAILMTDEEKFKLFCRLMRIGKMLSTAKVTHKKPD
ncbi:MAG: hypothetical protein ACOVP7_07585 [Lacibacter sp.]